MARHAIRYPKGFVSLLVIIILFVIILSLLGISISSFIYDSTFRENFGLLWKGVKWVWNFIVLYIKEAVYAFQDYFD